MKVISLLCWITYISALIVTAEIIHVDTLDKFNAAIARSQVKIKLKSGNYDLKNLSGKEKSLNFSGSNNMIDMGGAYVNVTVGLTRLAYIRVTGHNNVIAGGEFEDTYIDGQKVIKDFSNYNSDRENLASGLRGDPVMKISGNKNTVEGSKFTVRGSFPYGYGSIFGIGRDNEFGLNKRCGILITGVENTLDRVEIQQRAFGHGIYMQGSADKTLIKNSLVVGRLRKTKELYDEKKPTDLPKRANYKIPREDNIPIPRNSVHSLCEDGIRMYKIPGSIRVENCTVTKMRGGIRLYLGGPATVKNCTVTHCESTNYNLPAKGRVSESSGNFSFGPLSDYRLSRSGSVAEWTILPSPNAIGDHNILDVQGNNHHITLNRKKGSPLDSNEKRTIFITGANSIIINKTEYTITLADSAKGNKVTSNAPVLGNISANTVIKPESRNPTPSE